MTSVTNQTTISVKASVASLKFDPVGRFKLNDSTSLDHLVAMQHNSGLKAVTDGDPGDDALGFFACFEGLELTEIDSGHIYQEYPAMTRVLRMTGPIRWDSTHPVIGRFAALRDACTRYGAIAKLTVPAPSTLLAILYANGEWAHYYIDIDAAADDIAAVYRQMLRQLYEMGCRFIQFDDTSLGKLTYDNGVKTLLQGGLDIERYMDQVTALVNDSVADLPHDMSVAVYIDRNYDKMEIPQQADYSIIAPKLFGGMRVDAFYMDMNVDAANDFTFLRHLPEGKRVMLGLVPPLGTFEERSGFVAENLEEASEIVSLDRLGVTSSFSSRMESMPFEEIRWSHVTDMVKCVDGINYPAVGREVR